MPRSRRVDLDDGSGAKSSASFPLLFFFWFLNLFFSYYYFFLVFGTGPYCVAASDVSCGLCVFFGGGGLKQFLIRIRSKCIGWVMVFFSSLRWFRMNGFSPPNNSWPTSSCVGIEFDVGLLRGCWFFGRFIRSELI